MARYIVVEEPAAETPPPALLQGVRPPPPSEGGPPLLRSVPPRGRYIVESEAGDTGTAPSQFGSFARGALQGGTLEWFDELASLGSRQRLEESRALTKTYANANPWTYTAGKLAGGMIIPMGWAVRAARAGVGLAGMVRGGAVIGAGTGAVEGAGEHESRPLSPSHSPLDELKGMLGSTGKGAAVGGVTGAAIAPVLYGLGLGARAGWRFLADTVRGDDMAPALRKTAQALERQDTDPRLLSQALLQTATRSVRDERPEVLADVIRGYRNAELAGLNPTDDGVATRIANAVNAAHGTTFRPQDIGALNMRFTEATGTPRDLLRLSEQAAASALTDVPALRNLGEDVFDDVVAQVRRGIEAGHRPSRIANAVNRQHETALTPQQIVTIARSFNAPEANRAGLTKLMQGVISLPGRGREIALRNMGATMEAAPERMRGRIGEALGDQRFQANRRLLEQSRRAEAREEYGRAYTNEQDFNLDNIVISEHARAQAIGGESGSRLAQAAHIMAGTLPTRPAGKMPINNLERYHQARRTLDRLIEDERRRTNPDWNGIRLMRQLRRAANAEVYRDNPMMQAADQRFDLAMAREEALDLGRQFPLKSGQQQDDVLRLYRELEEHEPGAAAELRDWFMQGLSRRMADDIENLGGIPAQWVQPLTGGVRPAPQRALTEALGSPLPGAPVAQRANVRAGEVRGEPIPHAEGRAAAQRAVGVLEDEARLRKIFTDVWGNSNTASKLQSVEDLRELPRIAAEMATGGFAGVRNAIMQRLLNAMTERNAEHIARIVTETDPRVLYLALHDINRMRPRIAAGEAAIGGLAIGAGAAAGQRLTGK